MASEAGTRQACRLCRRRKVKCDSLPTCRNCEAAGIPCQYSPAKKRGPKPVQWQGNHQTGLVNSTSPPAIEPSSTEPESPVPLAVQTYLYPTSDSPLSTNSITANLLSPISESQTQAAVTLHVDLLASLVVAAPSDTAESIANQCILLYTKYVFGTVPMCHEATLRATVNRFFVSHPDENGLQMKRAWVTSCFAADNEGERIKILRDYTVLTSLCAVVTYVLLEPHLINKQLIAPIFLRTAREVLKIYEDYDLEHPNSSSLSIRLFLSSAVQIATGTNGVPFHILNQAGLIAMRMNLYDENSLEGRDPIEATLLRNAFWQLYVCDKTAMVMKDRPVTIHESLFITELTLKASSRTFVPLLEIDRGSADAGIEERLMEGFHVVCRLWTMAAGIIQAMEAVSRRSWDAHADRQARCVSPTQLSETYFEMITLTNDLSTCVQSPEEISPGISRDSDSHLSDILRRQRTSYLISLHFIKVFVLNTAIQCNMTEIMGLSAEPLTLAMRMLELAQDFFNVLESVPFLHLQAEGEHCAEKIRRVGILLLEIAHTAKNDVVKSRASQCAMRLIDMLARLNSRASDVLGIMIGVDK